MTQIVKSYSKGQVYEALKGFNQKKVREVMNQIISETDHIPIEYAKKEKTVKQSQLNLIFKRFE